ncbi:hypothetical protein X777_11314 [Ooceraea biroi]|uniref:Uncharacterized protein n=1 Tax=Ooceraea biroi TaxID=2015173 RepID=A0A026W2I4_OOCBI|nr:hypothetical protein X777_11314 [Ooceraea biroi]
MDRGIPSQLNHRAGLSDWTAQMMSDALRHRAPQDGVRVGWPPSVLEISSMFSNSFSRVLG